MKTLKDFENKKEFINYLVTNKAELIDFKKSVVKYTDPLAGLQSEIALKALSTNFKDDVASGIIKRTVIGNTYNWMDSVNDVLLPGVFTKSISERENKIWHLHDHEYKITSKVGKPSKIYEQSVSWADLGVNKIGTTVALFMDSNIMKDYNPLIFSMYLNGEITQHSVGMQYVKLELGVNDSDMKEEYAVWTKYIDQIGNKEKAIEDGYFWAVKEGKLHEISAVLAGANELTPTLDNKDHIEVEEVKEVKTIHFINSDFVNSFSLK